MRRSVRFGFRGSLRTGAPENDRLAKLAAERGTATRADHRRWVLRLPPRPARRCTERDRAASSARCRVPLGMAEPRGVLSNAVQAQGVNRPLLAPATNRNPQTTSQSGRVHRLCNEGAVWVTVQADATR